MKRVTTITCPECQRFVALEIGSMPTHPPSQPSVEWHATAKTVRARDGKRYTVFVQCPASRAETSLNPDDT